jgi:hypothetical protein
MYNVGGDELLFSAISSLMNIGLRRLKALKQTIRIDYGRLNRGSYCVEFLLGFSKQYMQLIELKWLRAAELVW